MGPTSKKETPKKGVCNGNMGFLGGSVLKNPPADQCRRRRFDPWVGKIPWRRKWQSSPVLLPGKSHGQRRSLDGYSPRGCKRVGHNGATQQQQQHRNCPPWKGQEGPCNEHTRLTLVCAQQTEGDCWKGGSGPGLGPRTRTGCALPCPQQPKRMTKSAIIMCMMDMGFPGGSDGKESACHAGDPGSIPGLGRSPGLASD